MHNSSYQHMQRLVSTYLSPGSVLKVVDIGSFDVNGSYRTLFTDPGWQYTGVDLEAGPGVDVVLASPYRLPFATGSVDVVVSDMAPNLSGIDSVDAARITHLIELAVELAQMHLKPQGALVVKVFHGSGYSQLVKLFKDSFKVVKPIKPKASRDKSSEQFLVGIEPKNRPSAD